MSTLVVLLLALVFMLGFTEAWLHGSQPKSLQGRESCQTPDIQQLTRGFKRRRRRTRGIQVDD